MVGGGFIAFGIGGTASVILDQSEEEWHCVTTFDRNSPESKQSAIV